MKQEFDFSKIIIALNESKIVSRVEIKEIDEVRGRGVYKIRCVLLPSRYKLEMRFVQTETEILYSYQLFSDKPIIRWDNASHYPEIKTYPHHFHTEENKVIVSDLKGDVIEDLQTVLTTIEDLPGRYEY